MVELEEKIRAIEKVNRVMYSPNGPITLERACGRLGLSVSTMMVWMKELEAPGSPFGSWEWSRGIDPDGYTGKSHDEARAGAVRERGK